MPTPCPEGDDFGSVRRLLALKRHEQPPPGYFPRLNREIMNRIQAEESDRASSRSWWKLLWGNIELKPAFAGAYGVVIFGILAVGLGVSWSAPTREHDLPLTTVMSAPALPTLVSEAQPAKPAGYVRVTVDPAEAQPGIGIRVAQEGQSSIQPVMHSGVSPFAVAFPTASQIQPASYRK